MDNTLDLLQLASAGQALARVDDTDYLAVQLVLARPAAGAITMYCAYRDWAATPIARLAEKDKAIAELEATLSRQAAESLKQAQRAIAAEARIKELELQLATPPDPIVCPDCGKNGWKSAKALQMHQQRAHQGMVAVRTDMHAQQFVEDLGWRCAAKGCPGAHARDLHDRDFCTLHAQRQLTNGHEVTT